MTIKIAYSSHISSSSLRKKTEQLHFSNAKSYTRNHFIIGGGQIVLQKQNIILSFDSNDNNTIKQLRYYVSHLFYGRVIGVDRENPITTCLEDVKEYLFLDG